MLVSPCRNDFFLSHKELYKFLLACQQNSIKSHRPQIVSISLEIEQVDPLVVIEKIAQPNQLTFYFENKHKGIAIAAIDAVEKFQAEGKQRFNHAQEFINSCLANTIPVGSINQPFAGPHFFCSFSFFDEIKTEYPFKAATVFLPFWQVVRYGDRTLVVANLIINPSVNLEKILHSFLKGYQKITLLSIKNKINLSNNTNKNHLNKKYVDSIDSYKQSVLDCLAAIKDNKLSKIVIAHALDVFRKGSFNLIQSLSNLRLFHPDCYIFSISNGAGQHFIGASPERLISIYDKQLMTDALAGSAPRGKTPVEDANLANKLLNSEKERHEHRVVIDFITRHLYELGIIPQVLPPRLRQLSNIQHLWTPIQAKIPTNVHPLEIVAQLHPTPAVAGASRDVACREIRGYESFERGLYAAPLGWVDYQGNSEFIVGIRSALIDGDRARLYAGAGIVAGSDPDKELAEIQLKLQALLKALT